MANFTTENNTNKTNWFPEGPDNKCFDVKYIK